MLPLNFEVSGTVYRIALENLMHEKESGVRFDFCNICYWPDTLHVLA